MRPSLNPPAWVMRGAKIDLDLANQRFWGGYVALTTQFGLGVDGSLIGGPGSSVIGYAPDSFGIVRQFPQFVPRITSGIGLWCNRNSTNFSLWCRDLTNSAWVKSSITAAKNQAGADTSANGASSLTATGSNGTVFQNITLASSSVVTSAYVKRLTGSGTISLTQDGGANYTDITSFLSASGYILVNVPTANIIDPVVGFKIGTSGDAIAVDFFQTENGIKPTTPLETTTAAVTRFTEENFMGNIGGHPNNGQTVIKNFFVTGAPCSGFYYYSGAPESDSATGWLQSSDGGFQSSGGADGGPFNYTGGSTSNNGNAGLGNMNKAAFRINGGSSAICLNGGPIATTGTSQIIPTSNGMSHFGIINNGANNAAGSLDGYISRMAFWNKEISNSDLVEFTRL